MRCPICGGDSDVLDTRHSRSLVTRRRRACAEGHAFTTYEVHAEVFCTAKARVREFSNTVARRLELRKRDAEIAGSLHAGWKSLATKFGISKSAVYLAAKRGRSILAKRP